MDTKSKQSKKRTYCAIYTRKSTAEGLDQDFTSLDAQREACESYINSQKHEGWTIIPERYDDGGFTGANTDRPGLQKLLNDIKEHKIDCVVVYKVDRLSRSLMDFAQLLEFFDKNNVAFVSVTQAFNTNTSMGRLTLNILLSFAQFEREIISERTKDKMAAARKRGQWLGGKEPLGYNRDKETKKLIINPEEAKLIKKIFSLYLQGNSLLKVTRIINQEGYRSKVTTSKKTGRTFGGLKYGITQIQYIITNVLYIGKVRYDNQIYAGQQEAIIDEETFKKVQEKIKENRVVRKATKNSDCTGLLSGLLHCLACNKMMFHTYTLKNKTHKYRYYICSNVQKRGYETCPNKSVNAQAVENTVIECLRRTLSQKDNQNYITTPEAQALLSEVWDNLYPQEKRKTLQALLKEAAYDTAKKTLTLKLLSSDGPLEFAVNLKSVRPLNKWHKEKEIEKEPRIRRSLILAHQLQDLFEQGKITGLKQAGLWLNINQSRLNHIKNLLLLAPAIQDEIIRGNDPTIKGIPEYRLRAVAEEVDWNKQTEIWQAIKASGLSD